jgi:hypothetical protein
MRSKLTITRALDHFGGLQTQLRFVARELEDERPVGSLRVEEQIPFLVLSHILANDGSGHLCCSVSASRKKKDGSERTPKRENANSKERG